MKVGMDVIGGYFFDWLVSVFVDVVELGVFWNSMGCLFYFLCFVVANSCGAKLVLCIVRSLFCDLW